MKRIQQEKLQSTIFAFSTVISGRTWQTIRTHDIKSKRCLQINGKLKRIIPLVLQPRDCLLSPIVTDGKDRDG